MHQSCKIAEDGLHADLVFPFGQIEEVRLVACVEAKAFHFVTSGVFEWDGLKLLKRETAVNEDAAVAEGAAAEVLLGLDGDLIEAVLGHLYLPGNPIAQHLPAVAADGVEADLRRVVRLGRRIALIKDRKERRARAVYGVLALDDDHVPAGSAGSRGRRSFFESSHKARAGGLA